MEANGNKSPSDGLVDDIDDELLKILKPRKAREPLQDLNQLLPTKDDDEETTTSEFSKRRVSFASTNKVKEFESAAECLTLKNAPVYDERFSISSDSCQSLMLSINESDKIHKENRSVTTASIECGEEDIELTETVGKIFDVSVKADPWNSNMDLTSIVPNISNKTLSCEDMEETIFPVNSSKSIVGENIECEIVSQGDISDSNMETTSLITHSMKAESILDESYYYNGDIQDLCEEVGETEPQLLRKSIFHPVHDNGPRKSIFETSALQPKFNLIATKLNETTNQVNHETNYEAVSMEMSAPQIDENVPPMFSKIQNNSKKFTFFHPAGRCDVTHNISFKNSNFNHSCNFQSNHHVIDKRIKHNTSMPVFSLNSQNEVTSHNSMQLPSQLENKTQYYNSSMHIASQELKINLGYANDTSVESFNPNGSHITTVSDQSLENETRYHDISMQLASHDLNVNMECTNITSAHTDDFNSNVLSNLENKTQYCNESMQHICHDLKIPLDGADVESVASYNNDFLDVTAPLSHETGHLHLEQVQTENKMGLNISSMNIINQKIEEGIDSAAIAGSQVVPTSDIKTQYHDSTMQLISLCDNGAELSSQLVNLNEKVDKNNCSAMQYKDHVNEKCDVIDVKSKKDFSQKKRKFQDMTPTKFDESVPDKSQSFNTNVKMSQVEIAELLDNTPNELVHKSILDNNSSSSDTSSPLTVGVNFSIFQKNKETRVEFSGTIDSNNERRSKSISNVHVNIINNNNKTQMKDKKVQELRFSMPAAKNSLENSKPCAYATFVDFTTSKDEEVEKLKKNLKCISLVERDEEQLEAATYPEFLKRGEQSFKNVNLNKKRLSSEMIDVEQHVNEMKRPSLINETRNQISVEEQCCLSNDALVISGNAECEEKQTCVQTCLIEQKVQKMRESKMSFVCEEKSVVSKESAEGTSFEIESLITNSHCESSGETKTDKNNSLTTPKVVEDRLLQKSDTAPPQMKDSSMNITGQSTAAATYSTSYSPTSLKSVGRQSACETDFEDNTLNNPSIIVNIGDSPHYKSFDLYPEALSSSEGRESSKGSPWVMNNLIESIPQDNMSKEYLVTNWLQNKMTKSTFENKTFIESVAKTKAPEYETLVKLQPQMTSEEGKTCERFKKLKNVDRKLSHEPNKNGGKSENFEEISQSEEEIQNVIGPTTDVDKKLQEANEDVGKSVYIEKNLTSPKETSNDSKNSIFNVEENLQEPNATMEESIIEETLKVQKEVQNEIEDIKMSAMEQILTHDESSSIEDVRKVISSQTQSETLNILTNKREIHQIKLEKFTFDDMYLKSEHAVKGEHSCNISMDESTHVERDTGNTQAEVTTDHCIQKCNVQIEKIVTSEKCNLSILSDDFEIKTHFRTEQIEQIMEENTDVPDSQDIIDMTMSVVENHGIKEQFVSNKEYLAHTKRAILEKVEKQLKSDFKEHPWLIKKIMDRRWIFQFQKFVLFIPEYLELIIEFAPSSNLCSARFFLAENSLREYGDLKKVAFRDLKLTCKQKLNDWCQCVDHVPSLLKLMTPYATWTLGFVRNMIRLEGLKDVQVEHNTASFIVPSFKNRLMFTINVNLGHLHRLSFDDVTVKETIGQIDKKKLRRICRFSDMRGDYKFFEKFVSEVYQTFDC